MSVTNDNDCQDSYEQPQDILEISNVSIEVFEDDLPGPSTLQNTENVTKFKLLVIPPLESSHKSEKIVSDENDKNRAEGKKFKVDLTQLFPKRVQPYVKHLRITILLLVWVICSAVLMAKNEKIQDEHQISIPKGVSKGYVITDIPQTGKLWIRFVGALLPPYYSNLSSHSMFVWVQFVVTLQPLLNNSALKNSNELLVQNISEVWKVPLVTENLIGVVPEVKQKHEFKLNNISCSLNGNCLIRVKMKTNLKTNLPVSLSYNVEPISMDDGIIYAAVLLTSLYVIIIFEIIHRTLAAMLASTMSVAILAALNARPTMAEIVSWIDIETLLLLFSMMTLVTIFSETGIFDYTAVLAYKLTGGKEWPLINSLCVLTALLSCFLDNVSTALLMTPITIRLCEVMMIDPVPVLICMIIYSNIGGAITPIGDPPNVIILSNPDVMRAGVTFTTFTVHMGTGVFLASIIVYIQLRFCYRNIRDTIHKEPPQVLELKREIAVWQRAAASMSSYSKDEENVKETLTKKSTRLIGKLQHNKAVCSNEVQDNYSTHLKDLEKKYPIRDKPLLIKSGLTLAFVVSLFFLHSVPELSRLGLGWTALLGVLFLLLLADRDDIESIFARVEWSTLLFFASLFILMEALARMGLIDWIGRETQKIIMSVQQESRLAVAILLILWVSAAASAFVDNIPLTTMMIRVATALADNEELQLPLQPLVWALSFGACFGGNGTLFGSSSNIVCAGVAEQHGYRFSFLQFMKTGFPVMVTSLLVITIYLMVAHVVLQWH